MKNSLLIAAVAMMAVPAMASKARLSALNNAAHLQDVQDVFKNASKLSEHGDWLTFEMGAKPSSAQVAPAVTTPQGPYTFAAPQPEGGFARGMGDAKYGFYLGHHSDWVAEARQPNAFLNGGGATGTYLTDENPINLFYSSKAGDLAWGIGLDYANSDKKTTFEKQNALGLNAGVSAQHWDAGLTVGLMNTYKRDSNTGTSVVDFKGKTAIGLNGTYTMDTLTFNGLVGMNGGKDDTTGVDLETTHYNVGVVNSHKAEGADFFYGVNYDMYTMKNKGGTSAKFEASQLPVFAGIEADATSWMVLRASVAQNFLLGSVKNEFAGSTESDTVPNNTTVAAGVGLKFNKLQLDGTLKAANSATAALDGNNMLANASVTYLF